MFYFFVPKDFPYDMILSFLQAEFYYVEWILRNFLWASESELNKEFYTCYTSNNVTHEMSTISKKIIYASILKEVCRVKKEINISPNFP